MIGTKYRVRASYDIDLYYWKPSTSACNYDLKRISSCGRMGCTMPEHRYGSASIPEPLNWRKLWPFLGYNAGGEVGVGGRSDVGCGTSPLSAPNNGLNLCRDRRFKTTSCRNTRKGEVIWYFVAHQCEVTWHLTFEGVLAITPPVWSSSIKESDGDAVGHTSRSFFIASQVFTLISRARVVTFVLTCPMDRSYSNVKRRSRRRICN